MTITENLKKLYVKMAGKGQEKDINEETIAEVIIYIAENWETIKEGIGGGKQAGKVEKVSVADATEAGSTYDQATVQTMVALANENKKKINEIITSMTEAGIMAGD